MALSYDDTLLSRWDFFLFCFLFPQDDSHVSHVDFFFPQSTDFDHFQPLQEILASITLLTIIIKKTND